MPRTASRHSVGAMSSDEFLAAACAVGRRIADTAIWDDGRCSWVGAAIEPTESSRPAYVAIGPELYNGTAGVGLYLAQLAAVTGDDAVRRTAIGALRHAVEQAPRDGSCGLHLGPLGIAWAAARVAALLEVEELLDGARTLAFAPRRSGGWDLLGGAAGASVALLGLGRELGEAGLVEAAAAAGASLLDAATLGARGWSWANPDIPGPRHLCGAAHGAAGIGWALLELFVATGDDRFRAAAEGAFTYERSWLDRESGTWPDLRVRRGRIPFMVATWCHGEAGIALSRLRATSLLSIGPHSQDADISLRTLKDRLTARVSFAIDDLSLCHGYGGAALALLAAGDLETPSALGRVAVERYGKRGDYPCGVYGSTPGLFRGLSGIAWLLLCLHDPAIPSPLSLTAGG
jgi:lantibiotic modifying enzyme